MGTVLKWIGSVKLYTPFYRVLTPVLPG